MSYTRSYLIIMERNLKIDFYKFFAIFTVVLGHSIQYGSGTVFLSAPLLENPVFRFIYSFHMPLFMLLSGYLFYLSVTNHSFQHNVISRFTTLFIPIIVWNIVPFIAYTWHDRPHTLRYLFQAYLITMTDNSWFLWAIFYCSFAVLLVNKFFKDNVFIYLFGLVVTFIIPDSHNLFLYKFMYPYFLIGYFYHKNSGKIKEDLPKQIKSRKGFGILTIVYFILLFFFHTDSYIYSSKYTLLGKDILLQLGIDLFRFCIGLAGSLWILLLLEKIYPLLSKCIAEFLCLIGRNSLGIYMISGLVFIYVLPTLTSSIHKLNYLIVLGETAVILFGTLLLSLLLKKWSVTNFLFLGGRR